MSYALTFLSVALFLAIVALIVIAFLVVKKLIDSQVIARKIETETVVLVGDFTQLSRIIDEDHGIGWKGLRFFIPWVETFKEVPEWARPPVPQKTENETPKQKKLRIEAERAAPTTVYLGEIRDAGADKKGKKSDDVPCRDGVEVHFMYDLVYKVREDYDQDVLHGLFYGKKDAYDRFQTELHVVFSALAKLAWAQGVLDIRADMLNLPDDLVISWYKTVPDPNNPGRRIMEEEVKNVKLEVTDIVETLLAAAKEIGFELVKFTIRDAQPTDQEEYDLIKAPQMEMMKNVAADFTAERERKLAQAPVEGKIAGLAALPEHERGAAAQMLFADKGILLAFQGMSRDKAEQLLMAGGLTGGDLRRSMSALFDGGRASGGN
ncbi:hypothetical protein KKC88_05435 [Patescibacteria group bacterium]|nr:hypothetical protein [Patescibacteria group bacterium]MBU1673063.1 hypothetical protein [Patescibacteria group bacterium]MBU1963669.1 hypothetical protein [Patescibacteria group bacterium]